MTKKEDADQGFIAWFSDLTNNDVAIAGGKGASLGEMYQNKFPIPPGFVVTAEAYRYFIQKSGIQEHIMRILNETDIEDTNALAKASKDVRKLIEESRLPDEMRETIIEAYEVLDVDRKQLEKAKGDALNLLKRGHEPPFVAVRSSATTEDLADASFAGQQETFLNVKGDHEVIDKIKKCFSSLFTARAIYYRVKKGFQHDKAYLAVVVQKMVDSAKSGVMFSQNPLKDDGRIVLEAVYGLGEGIVSGKISPDYYAVDPEADFKIEETKTADKKIALVRNSAGKTETVKLSKDKSQSQVLTRHEVIKLAHYAQQLEEHYGKPQDIEFAIEGDEIYIVQSRPITTKTKEKGAEVSGNALFTGLPASPGVASGVVKVIHDLDELDKIKKGNVLVTTMTNPDMVVSMAKASAIVTDEGGITSHAAIVSREMGIPAVVGTQVATEKLKDGQVITVDGFSGKVVEGRGEERKIEIKPAVPTKTEMKVIVDLPDYAERAAAAGVKGIGLIRSEATIAQAGKHPVWYVKEDKIKDYIHVISQGLRKMAKHFDKLWMRTSDVRSDEYKNLEGAPQKDEGNPMLGDHGIRFSLKNQDILEAEFRALKEVADDHDDKEFGVMLPQVISASEVTEAKKIYDSVKMPENVKFGIMIETPAAVIIIDELVKTGIQFISFGTNDLTQYTLAVDRNNEDVQGLHDEMHPAVLRSLSRVIETCRHFNIITSICGQAGSKPDMAKFLVQKGINSISVNADAAFAVSSTISQVEKELASQSDGQNQNTVTAQVKSGPEQVHHGTPSTDTRTHENIQHPQGTRHETGHVEEMRQEEYNPGIPENDRRNVPPLNEAIPVSSEDLHQQDEMQSYYEMSQDDTEAKGGGTGMETEKKEEEQMEEEVKTSEPESVVETEQENVLNAEVQHEMAELQAAQQQSAEMKKRQKMQGQEEEKGDTSLDIF